MGGTTKDTRREGSVWDKEWDTDGIRAKDMGREGSVWEERGVFGIRCGILMG